MQMHLGYGWKINFCQDMQWYTIYSHFVWEINKLICFGHSSKKMTFP